MDISRRQFGYATLGLATSALVASAAPRVPMSILVPAYFHPSGRGRKAWATMTASAAKVPITAIANPASGPGKARVPEYTAVLDAAVKEKLALVGYVSTSYGKVPLDRAKADITRWLDFYPQIGGFFFDEQASGVDKIDHYAELVAHARKARPGATIVTNPGVICDEAYLSRPIADVACIFEHHSNAKKFSAPEWTRKYEPSRFAAIPYAIPTEAEMKDLLREMAAQRIGAVYLTDDSGRNPYDRLPSYWEAEVEAVAALNAI